MVLHDGNISPLESGINVGQWHWDVARIVRGGLGDSFVRGVVNDNLFHTSLADPFVHGCLIFGLEVGINFGHPYGDACTYGFLQYPCLVLDGGVLRGGLVLRGIFDSLLDSIGVLIVRERNLAQAGRPVHLDLEISVLGSFLQRWKWKQVSHFSISFGLVCLLLSCRGRCGWMQALTYLSWKPGKWYHAMMCLTAICRSSHVQYSYRKSTTRTSYLMET
ncbi:hypothetical protein GE09DRAFT_651147 [Coniochaeta sp. 2T2.1]|nr:hypothetical protein GE09DRAFT_651147 [Coniochaeta sp. 2T2.1]